MEFIKFHYLHIKLMTNKTLIIFPYMNVMQHIFPCLCVIKLYTTNKFCNLSHSQPCDKWFPVTTAWRVLRLRMEERHPIWRVAANKLNKRSRTADKGWSSSLGFGEVLTTPPRENPC